MLIWHLVLSHDSLTFLCNEDVKAFLQRHPELKEGNYVLCSSHVSEEEYNRMKEWSSRATLGR